MCQFAFTEDDVVNCLRFDELQGGCQNHVPASSEKHFENTPKK